MPAKLAKGCASDNLTQCEGSGCLQLAGGQGCQSDQRQQQQQSLHGRGTLLTSAGVSALGHSDEGGGAAVVLTEAWQQVVLRRYAQFDGRASRAEYWWFVLANTIVVIVLSVLSRVSAAFAIVNVVYGLALLILRRDRCRCASTPRHQSHRLVAPHRICRAGPTV